MSNSQFSLYSGRTFTSDSTRLTSLNPNVKCSGPLDYSSEVQCSEMNKELADDFCFAPVGKASLMVLKQEAV